MGHNEGCRYGTGRDGTVRKEPTPPKSKQMASDISLPVQRVERTELPRTVGTKRFKKSQGYH